MFDYNDIEYEPSDADEILSEAADKLAAAVKSHVAARFANIEVENERLRLENKRLAAINLEYGKRERAIEAAEIDIKRRAAKMGVKDFMGQYEITMWSVTTRYELGPKCDRCDDSRHIPYKTPLGNDAREQCACAAKKRVWIPQEQQVYELYKSGYDNRLTVWYRPAQGDDGAISSRNYKEVYTGESYDSIERRAILFNDKSACSLYCDWLNNK